MASGPAPSAPFFRLSPSLEDERKELRGRAAFGVSQASPGGPPALARQGRLRRLRRADPQSAASARLPALPIPFPTPHTPVTPCLTIFLEDNPHAGALEEQLRCLVRLQPAGISNCGSCSERAAVSQFNCFL